MISNILEPEQLVELKYLLKEYADYSGNTTKTGFPKIKQLIEYNENIRKSYIDRMVDIAKNSTSRVEAYQKMAQLLYEMKDVLVDEILNSDPTNTDQKVKRVEKLLQKCSLDYMNNNIVLQTTRFSEK